MTQDGKDLLNELMDVTKSRNERRLERAKKELDQTLAELMEKSKMFFDYADDIVKFKKYASEYSYKGDELKMYAALMLQPADSKDKIYFRDGWNSKTSKYEPYFVFNKADYEWKEDFRWKNGEIIITSDHLKEIKNDKTGDGILKIVAKMRLAINEIPTIEMAHDQIIALVREYIERKKGEC